ncbi:hypothetical protein Q6A89_08655 [Aliarcobacter skirrowii]|uniref:hypothetical protein n=1 Tax=Aliarcobacter skirrowii TaxID=28200 RepID=UPI0029ABBD39|nr:hypothetical protein [Aliarcobacter skirrowii]MDX4060581.1 hypothetical protein [Aliarcobacter skirrowii]
MKKLSIYVALIFLAVVLLFFIVRNSIENRVDAKVKELNQNGFFVNINKNIGFLSFEAKGKIEIAYPYKTMVYTINQMSDGELKKQFQDYLELLPKDEIDVFVEGLTFDYDIVSNGFGTKYDLNLYLTKLPIRYMQHQNYFGLANTLPTNMMQMLNNKEIRINIDQDGNFKLDDLTLTLKNSGLLNIRGVNGDKKTLNIPLFKVEKAYYGGYIDERLIIENMNFSYFENKKSSKIDSKIFIENFTHKRYETILEFKNLRLDSYSKYLNDDLQIKSDLSIDTLSKKRYNFDFTKVLNNYFELKDSSFVIEFENLPYKEYLDFSASTLTIDYNKALEKQDEFFDLLYQSAFMISLEGNSNDLSFMNDKYYETLKFDAKIKPTNFTNFSTLNDIFSIFKVDLEIDSKSAQKFSQAIFKDFIQEDIVFEDTNQDNIKKLAIELKEDGLYINGNLLINSDKLIVQNSYNSNNQYNSLGHQDYLYNTSSKLYHTYELISPNLLRVNFKYKTSLKNDLKNGGITVSFPQILDGSRVKAINSKTFKDIKTYQAGDDILGTTLNTKDIKAQYLQIDAFDDKWSNIDEEKEFSVDFDISGLTFSTLEINLRAYSNSKDLKSELVPTKTESFTKDQQNYYIKIADIYIYDLITK